MNNVLSHLDQCIEEQLKVWPDARQRFEELRKVQTKVISSSGLRLQFNPARIISTTADIHKGAIKKRPCFLCRQNRPAQQIPFDLGDGYDLLINPFPILSNHFTVVSREHQPQSILVCCDKLLKIASELQEGYIVFYNGPHSGASAPDHLHLQIGFAMGIPLIDKILNNNPPEGRETITIEPFGFPILIYFGNSTERFKSILNDMTILDGEYEPRLNIISLNRSGQVITTIIPRSRHRPDCYYQDGDKKYLISPGAIDMCGLVITPRPDDFERVNESLVLSIYREVTPHQPELKVGIMAAPKIRFSLKGNFSDGEKDYYGEHEISLDDGQICWNGKHLHRLKLCPTDGRGIFTLHDVTIGLGFHWQRNEDQTFNGSLLFIPENDMIHAVNVLPVENYLTSVISSEMSATAPKEFLKAHAVISRSWVLAQLKKKVSDNIDRGDTARDHIIKWYDHDQHQLFDVCADDHCQRYQGITKVINTNAEQAIKETYAETLVSDGHLCDARFSKCCGGITEQFESCWQDRHYSYLIPVRDSSIAQDGMPDLTNEEEAEKWILSTPKSFCSSVNGKVLSRVLNGFDQETRNFYRWEVCYSTQQITDIFRKKSGLDIGIITDLKPLKRGPSGRLYELDIIGTEGHVIMGKELEIRRVLSETHLFSSAFIVTKKADGFVLKGAGWGHGVGLCQIGAAIMGSNGYSYKEILKHYYPNTRLGRFY